MIGSALVWALNNRGIDNILIVDRLRKDEKWKNLVPLQYADFMDPEEFIEATQVKGDPFGTIGSVFHMGACSSTTETDAGYLMKNNFQFTRKIADWAVGRRLRFVYASSAATYGDGSEGMSDQLKDLGVLRPLNMYGYSKQLFDLSAAKRGLDRGIVGLKFFNVFGPNEYHKGDMRSVVFKAFHQIMQTGRIQLFKSTHPDYGDGQQKRDFLYVTDAAEMALHLAERPLAGGLFNIGSGKASTWIELAQAVFAALGKPPQIEFVDMPEHMRAKYQNFTQADMTRFAETGYQENLLTLEEAVADYVQNYLLTGKHLGDEPWEEVEQEEEPQKKLPIPSRPMIPQQ